MNRKGQGQTPKELQSLREEQKRNQKRHSEAKRSMRVCRVMETRVSARKMKTVHIHWISHEGPFVNFAGEEGRNYIVVI